MGTIGWEVFKACYSFWLMWCLLHVPDGSRHDVYVVYHSQEKSKGILNRFLSQALPHVLEQKCGYRVFIHGRDDMPRAGLKIDIHITLSAHTCNLLIRNSHCTTEGTQLNANYTSLSMRGHSPVSAEWMGVDGIHPQFPLFLGCNFLEFESCIQNGDKIIHSAEYCIF